jgi:hypothetical protein
MSYLRYLCLFAYSGVRHILCCVLLVFFVFFSLSLVPYVWLILVNLFRPFDFLAHKDFYIIWLFKFSTSSEPDEGVTKNALCGLNKC